MKKKQKQRHRNLFHLYDFKERARNYVGPIHLDATKCVYCKEPSDMTWAVQEWVSRLEFSVFENYWTLQISAERVFCQSYYLSKVGKHRTILNLPDVTVIHSTTTVQASMKKDQIERMWKGAGSKHGSARRYKTSFTYCICEQNWQMPLHLCWLTSLMDCYWMRLLYRSNNKKISRLTGQGSTIFNF